MNLADKNRELGADCYYETTVTRPQWPALTQDTVVDVLVIGGGLAGLSTALELVEKNHSVCVLEAERVCGHASGRNGGQAIVGYACGQAWLEQHLGLEQAKRLWDLSLASVARMKWRMAHHAIECDSVWSYMTVADKKRKARELQVEAQHMKRHYGQDMVYLSQYELQSHIASDRYVAGLLDPASGHLNPLRYGLGLAHAAQQAGVQLHEHSPALSLTRQSQDWLVRTDKAQVRARHVVLAGNCGLLWQSQQLAPALHARIMPVGTYVVATKPLSPTLAQSLLPKRAAVCDNNFVLDYFRLSTDHRMLFGGRVSYTTATPSRLRESMRQRMLRVFPQLAHAPIEHTWGGFVDISRNRAPDWGLLDERLYFVQGFSGHGLAATTLAGMVTAQAIAGDKKAFDVFARIRQAPFPGGQALRIPLLLLGTAFLRVMDGLG